MIFVALLRGINVGGKNIIRMADLKLCFEKMGFSGVRTFIQSGNVIFSSPKKGGLELEGKIEKHLSGSFNYSSRVLVRSKSQITQVITGVPSVWNTKNNLRCYIAFVKSPVTPSRVIKETVIKEGIDEVTASSGAIYMSTQLSGLTNSGLNKLTGLKIYKFLTIRNYSTILKIAALM